MAQARRTPESWRSLVEEQGRSGLTLRAFAAAQGISPNTLAWWKYTRRRGDHSPQPDPAPRLVAVDVLPDETRGGGIEIVLRGGRVVRVRGPIDTDLLARVVTVLEERC